MRWKNTRLGHLNNESRINREKIFQLLEILRSTYKIYHFHEPLVFSVKNIKLGWCGSNVMVTTLTYNSLDGWLTFPYR